MRKLLLILLFSCTSCSTLDIQNVTPTAYTQELSEITSKIDALERKPISSIDQNDALQSVFYRYRRASLTVDFYDFKAVETALQHALRYFGPSTQLSLISAHFNFKLHRLDQAKFDLEQVDKFGGHPQAEALKADIALQEGKYLIAEEAYDKLCKENPSWDNLARFAYYKAHTGLQEQADMLYEQAQEKLSVKEMQHFAWLELQRGILDLELKRYDDALAHYRRAEQAYSGYWLIREHIAEVYALLGRKTAAIDLYGKIIAETNKPEFISALAKIYDDDKRNEAFELFQLADNLFAKEYSIYPSAAAGHVIESLLEREKIHPKLLEYANVNHQLRPNAQSKYLLAKTYLKLGEQDRAMNLMAEVMQSQWRTSDIESLAQQLKLN